MDHFNQFHQFNQNQIPINAVNPDYGEFVIKPPEANNTGGRVPTTLLIDSRDRNYQHYPNPQEYKIDLKRKYFDVVAIELKKGMIPQSGLYINEQNNLIHFNESIADDHLTATIPVGFYTQAELFTAIETAMNAVGDSTYTVSLTVKKQVRIKSDISGGNNYFVVDRNYRLWTASIVQWPKSRWLVHLSPGPRAGCGSQGCFYGSGWNDQDLRRRVGLHHHQ